jgi:hypothetical protein
MMSAAANGQIRHLGDCSDLRRGVPSSGSLLGRVSVGAAGRPMARCGWRMVCSLVLGYALRCLWLDENAMSPGSCCARSA